MKTVTVCALLLVGLFGTAGVFAAPPPAEESDEPDYIGFVSAALSPNVVQVDELDGNGRIFIRLVGVVPPPEGSMCRNLRTDTLEYCREVAQRVLWDMVGRFPAFVLLEAEQPDEYGVFDGRVFLYAPPNQEGRLPEVSRMTVIGGMSFAGQEEYLNAQEKARADGFGMWDPFVYSGPLPPVGELGAKE